MKKQVVGNCLACKRELLEDDRMVMGEHGEVFCNEDCCRKSKACAGCNQPMDGDTSMWRKDGYLYCSEDCMLDYIPGLRGKTRAHLAFAGEHYQIFLEVCHQACSKNRENFAICGTRYVVVDSRTKGELDFSFPREVEQFVKTGQEIPKE